MKLGITLAQLMDMEVLCQGNPKKMAEYTQAKRKYDDMIAEFFNEEDGVEYIPTPTPYYVEELERRAENGTDRDKARAIILRERYDARENKKNNHHHKIKATKSELRDKLGRGDEITAQDMEDAYWLSRHNPSSENLALYSQLKRAHENPTIQDGRQAEHSAKLESDKVTPEKVQQAYDKAKETGRMTDHVAYASLKRKLADQSDE